MKRSFNFRAMLLALGISALTAAAQAPGPSVQVLEAYAPATKRQERSAEVYALFVNVETDDQLIGADCAIARRVELVAADGSRLPYQEFHFHEDVEIGFREGATHLHLVGLKHPLVRGQSFVVTLHFAATGALTLNVIVV